MLGGAAHDCCQGRKVVGAAPVSKNRLGLSRGPPASMGIVATLPFGQVRCGAVRRDHAGALTGAMTCCLVHRHRIDRVRDDICRTGEPFCGGQRGARPAPGGAVFGVAWQDRADRWQRTLDHELLHHIGGRGGGCGRRVPKGSIRPPQQGQTSMSWPVSSRRRSCQRCGDGSSGAGGGAASSSRQRASFSAR